MILWPVLMALLVAGGASLVLPSGARAESVVTFRLSITNLTSPGVPITHGAYLVHQDLHALWEPETMATLALERIAEVGSPGLAILSLGARELFLVTEAPGDRVSWEISAVPGDLFSFAQMLSPTNDAFIGVDSLALFDGMRPTSGTYDLIVWDGGTEENAPVGSGFEGGQPDTIHLEENLEAGIATSEPIQAHEQFPGVQARLTVTPIVERLELEAGLQLIGWTGVETTTAEFLATNAAVSWVFWWDAANGAWLVDSVTLPDSLRPTIVLSRGSAFFLVVETRTTISVPLIGAEPETLAS